MRTRAEQIGGSCEVAGAPGAGTTVTLSLPLPRSHPPGGPA
jgi:signal transduction histidine kinase